MWRPAVVVVNKTLQRGIVDDEILLGVTASRLVMHFWFDQYYCQSVKMGSISNMNRRHQSRSGLEFLEACRSRPGRGSPFVFLWLVLRSLCAVVLLLVFGGGMSLLNQVTWAGACVHLDWTNEPAPWWADLDPISNICPLSLVERMPSYANFYTRFVKPF